MAVRIIVQRATPIPDPVQHRYTVTLPPGICPATVSTRDGEDCPYALWLELDWAGDAPRIRAAEQLSYRCVQPVPVSAVRLRVARTAGEASGYSVTEGAYYNSDDLLCEVAPDA